MCAAGETLLIWNQREINWKGAWLPTTAYQINDPVSYQGSSYIAKVNNVGVAPTNATNWDKLAAKGGIGATGPAEATGPAGNGRAIRPQGEQHHSGVSNASGRH